MKTVIRYCYYLLARCFAAIVLLLPYRAAVRCGGILGFIAYYLVKQSRTLTEENLRASFPEKTPAEIRRIARSVFVNQGKNAFELFSFPKLSAEKLLQFVTIENKEAFEAALSGKHGVLIASAHCGNWEIMGAALSRSGFPINVIARRIYIEGLNRMLVGFRESMGERVILRSGQESARQILRSLRHNEAIGMLIDQDTAVPGVFVNFFSRPAWTPSGLATLALRTGASVILALDVRLSGDKHRVVLAGPITMTQSGNADKDVLENTQQITALIEQHIRTYPEQWVWMHGRWKTKQPVAEVGELRPGYAHL